jgi:hypothetical protein
MSEAKSMAEDRKFDEASAGWPPKGVGLVCNMPACGEVGMETGHCVDHQAQLIYLLARRFGGLVAASFAPASWYRLQLGPEAMPDQGIALKRAVVSSYKPATDLAYDDDRTLRDYGRGDVKDAPANRERREAFFSALPNRKSAADLQPGSKGLGVLMFALGILVGGAIVIGFLYGFQG